MRDTPLGDWLNGASVLLPGRLWSKASIHGPDECWIWTAATDRGGYGRVGLTLIGERMCRSGLAHRVAYELAVGPIPEGFQVDHLCRTRACINPKHLEAVTQRENIIRSHHPSAISFRTNRCRRGHHYSEHGYVVPNTGHRQCMECRRITIERRAAA